MNKNYKTIKLEKGELSVYDFGNIKLHAYKTNDFIDDEVFIVEKSGKAVIIEAPCFYDNIKELTQYLYENNINVVGLLLAYHMAGASFLKGIPVYATKNADNYGHTGGGAGLISNFTQAFGDVFDNSIFTVTDYINEGKVSIGEIEFNITITSEAFDIEIPEINAVYTHMLGHDCHSIVAGAEHDETIIDQLNGYIQKGYDFVLTSHYTPEDLKDVQTKIDYLKNLQVIAKKCTNANEFKTAVKKQYNQYSGENYLDMTAGFFFK